MVQKFSLGETNRYFYKFVKENPVYDDFVLINKDGFVVSDTQGNNFSSNISVIKRPYFKRAPKKDLYIIDMSESKVTKDPVIIIATPLLSEEQEFNGVIFGTIHSKEFYKTLLVFGKNYSENTYIVNYNRYLISGQTCDDSEKQRVTKQKWNQIQQIESKKLQLIFDKWHSPTFITSASVKYVDWLVVSEIKVVDALKPLISKFLFVF